MASQDLQKFSAALNNSIIEFHQKKICKINEILERKWSECYEAIDIEKILIVATSTEKFVNDENNGKKPKDSNSPKKSRESPKKGIINSNTDKTKYTEEINVKLERLMFNYKVVMLRNGQELEMRGRCSEGQKVLASLIIRMALAEAFNCNIISLDEPTTNLDSTHMSKIATLLSDDFEKMRQNQQLLLITHSGDFVDRIRQKSDIKQYFQLKVETDYRGSFSCIQKKDSKNLYLNQ